MSAFDGLTEKVSSLTQTGIAKARMFANAGMSKAKEMTEIAKLKLDIASEEDSIRKAYIEIGKLYYAERSHAPEGPYAALCERITEAKEKIRYHEERIADLKASPDYAEEDMEEFSESQPEDSNASTAETNSESDTLDQ